MCVCVVLETKNSGAFVAKLAHLWLCSYSHTESTKEKKKCLKRQPDRLKINLRLTVLAVDVELGGAGYVTFALSGGAAGPGTGLTTMGSLCLQGAM